jgi:N-acetylmuramoyl-L-alanine amidase
MTPEPYVEREQLDVPAPPLPPVPELDGPLALRVVYPPAGALVDASDSSFVFGSTGTGRAALTINGQQVPVLPNGSWLAWMPLPPGPDARFDLVAWRGGDTVRVVHPFRRRVDALLVRSGSVWVDTASFTPRGRVWWSAGEPLMLSVRAVEGATIRLRPGSGGAPVGFAPLPTRTAIAEAVRAFDNNPARLRTDARADRYTGVLQNGSLGPPLGPPVGVFSTPVSSDAVLEVARNGDTVLVPWPVQLTRLAEPFPVIELDDDISRQNNTDRLTPGRALPGGTYHWFFPTGTRATVTGRVNGDLRIGLASGQSAWVSALEAVLFPAGAALSAATLGSITATPGRDRVAIRFPLGWRVPFQVEEHPDGVTLSLYNAVGDPNWIRYGSTTGPLQRITWRQRSSDIIDLTATLAGPLWGYRTRWENDDLVLELRLRPHFDREQPLQGRLIVIDPGHPPAGSTGPTGLTEAEANLGISLELERLLSEDGARVVLTRRDDRPVDLWPRVKLADSLDADLLISIHNNAFPDGINPFVNHGSGVFYFHPRSIPLAQAIQDELGRRLGVPVLGIARGDLALVRGTWMPSVLVEGLFMMIPEQEAALRSSAGRLAYAEAVRAGIRAFFRGGRM